MTTEPLAIRPLATLEEYRECVRLQEEIWGEGFSERAPVSLLKVSSRLGGVVAGAFDDQDRMAGFVFGMTGLEGGRAVHWSDMLAVRPEYRNRGLGSRLKAFQRKALLERGIDTCYWTFDPLRARNAHLNFAKLGVVVREYQRQMYGDTDSPLHRGIGTDRFVALWLLESDRVRRRIEALESGEGRGPVEGGLPPETAAALEGDPGGEHLSPGEPRLGHEAETLTVAVPTRIEPLLEETPELAVAWREATRAAFEAYLPRWEVVELLRDEPLSRYLLRKRDDRSGRNEP